jgi:L-lysine exporter family protein LysE/ArgO
LIPHARWDNFLMFATLGLGAAAPIGPVNVELARRTLRAGFWAGLALGSGAVTVDCLYAVISSQSLGQWVSRPAVKWSIAIVGFMLLAYLGVMSLQAAAKHLRTDPLSEASAKSDQGLGRNGYVVGVLMTLLNPMTLIFWFVEVPTNTQDRARDLPMICTGVFIGTFSWVLAFSGFLGVLGKWRQKWWLAAADGLGGMTLLVLAAVGLWHLAAHSL